MRTISPCNTNFYSAIYKHYDNSTQFYWDYFGSDIDTLVGVIKRYKQTHGAHKKDEEYLADLLK